MNLTQTYRLCAAIFVAAVIAICCTSCSFDPITTPTWSWLGGSLGTKATSETKTVTRADGTTITVVRTDKDEATGLGTAKSGIITRQGLKMAGPAVDRLGGSLGNALENVSR